MHRNLSKCKFDLSLKSCALLSARVVSIFHPKICCNYEDLWSVKDAKNSVFVLADTSVGPPGKYLHSIVRNDSFLHQSIPIMICFISKTKFIAIKERYH